MAKTKGVIAKSMAKSNNSTWTKKDITSAKSALTKAKKAPKHSKKGAAGKYKDRHSIDEKIDRDTFHVLHAIREFSVGEIVKGTGLGYVTVNKLFMKPEDGGTIRPGHKTLARLLHFAGLEFDQVPIGTKQYIETFEPGSMNRDNIRKVARA